MSLENYLLHLQKSLFVQADRDPNSFRGQLHTHVGILFNAALENPRLIKPMKRFVAAFLGVADFDAAMKYVIQNNLPLHPEEIVSLAGAVAGIAILDGNPDLATELWSLVLTTTRADLSLGLVRISDKEQQDYDSARFHGILAREMAFFAVSNLFGKRPAALFSVLDLCCGTGLPSSYFHHRCDSLVGIDLELSGLRASGRHKNYTGLLEGDVRRASALVNEQFDLILMNGAAYFFKDLDWLMGLSSVLRPGGEICLNVFLCPNDHDTMTNCAGTVRNCHSLPYLSRISGKYGMQVTEVVPTTIYTYPGFHVRIEKP
ncbi:MAG TPA: class I SAM-dependent methyltransferase [Rhodocyclaceae bacterium]|jgi:ubiquinone/menaquinone biosynthesis C-methylase UbiE|nr:class I SAM-dependent methyltransferase [Rhodocyclaceae bacterium]HMW77295.1 class I SAM-dependent methyltransferase [Rhodocyclaceae bacterium]HNE41896.1 class I SAM-dependent methyltransferase [Rhodocyclaceae bacterium]HNL21914.1 class I SAM-dependent methyltransferase [Rhodocyclaceae bacterium]HNM21808.1 class I SAM-dependent methyltransferase [Rhodocyclaceae bacterium]